MTDSARVLNLKAALLSALILLLLIGVWQLATLPVAAGPAVAMTPEQIEYAKLLGKDPGLAGVLAE